jgi:hypothetical protein
VGYFELRRDFDSSLSVACHRDPSPATARQSRGPDLLTRPSQVPASRLAFFVIGYCMGEYEIRRDFDSKKRGRRRRHPPHATARQSWYPDLLMRPSQAPISRFASFVVGYFMGGFELRRDFDSKKRGGPRRDPPPATACQSWHLAHETVAGPHKVAELKCCASLCFSRAVQRIYFYTMIARARQAPAQSQALACRRRLSVRFRQNIPRARGPPRWGTRSCSVFSRVLSSVVPFA